MSIGAFTDKQHEPTESDIHETIGLKLPLWDELICHIKDTYTPAEDFAFLYGKNYGWGWRFRTKGKLLTAFYPSSGGFTVQIILSPEDIETVQAMDAGKNVQQAIERANPYPEGRWLFIPVESPVDLVDIRRLLELRNNWNRRVKK